MEDREVGVVGEAGRSLQEKAGVTHRLATRPSVGDSKNEGDPGMTLAEENWDKEDVLCVDGWDT